jgi:ABC-2 type transport system permease protein
MGMGILFSSIFTGIEIIWDRQFGFLKETLVAPVSRVNIMIGRTLGGATIALVQGCIILLISVLIGFRPVSLAMLPLALLFMFLISVLFTALGTALASRMEDMHGFQLITNFLIMPIFFLSGALFPLNNLPSAISIVASLDPLSYGVDGIRGALLGASHFGIPMDFAVLSAVTLLLLAIGSWLFSKIQI